MFNGGKGGEKMSRVAVKKCDTQVIDKHPVFILSRLSFNILAKNLKLAVAANLLFFLPDAGGSFPH